MARHREAVQEWRAALTLDETNPTLRKGLAVSLMNLREHAEAGTVLAGLASAYPKSAEYLVLIGRNCLALEQPQQAVEYFRGALRLDPALVTAHAGIGEALLRIGQSDEAISHLEAALAADADGTRRYQLARAYRAIGRTDAANQMLAEYKKLQAEIETERRELEREYPITAPQPEPRD
jgi:predicted Zn-dependent protease